MNKNHIRMLICACLSFMIGAAISGASVYSYESKKKDKKAYAGKIVCVPNPVEENVDVYLQMNMSTADLMQCSSVEFEVKVRESKRNKPGKYRA